jgi:hypothetical protein
LGKILVADSMTATAIHFVGSSAMVFAAMEHLAFVSGIVAVASEIGGAAFALTSMVGSSVMA